MKIGRRRRQTKSILNILIFLPQDRIRPKLVGKLDETMFGAFLYL